MNEQLMDLLLISVSGIEDYSLSLKVFVVNSQVFRVQGMLSLMYECMMEVAHQPMRWMSDGVGSSVTTRMNDGIGISANVSVSGIEDFIHYH